MTSDKEEDDAAARGQGMLPSHYMRRLRPENYSDTADRVDYELGAALLAFHLDTITERNQTHGFEIFCRKLCERVICPNLRPQTGPDGGGDSKADTETFPVADEIGTLAYVGEPNAASENWGFAFSAQKTWSAKVRSDVAGLAATGRHFDRIYFVTSRAARSKDATRIEKELTDRYRMPVMILDRTWIVNEVVEKGRKDLAVDYLNVGRAVPSPRVGPADYSRLQRLEELERDLADPAQYDGLDRDKAIDALVAAKLSRGLELPRVETDGRFLRAVRLADAAGGYHPRLEARYEHVWTAFWWFGPEEFGETRKQSLTSRSLVIEPRSHQNLEMFLSSYGRYGAYYLVPAIWRDGMDEPDFLADLPILKRQLVVLDADQVGEHDLETMALRQLSRDED